MQSARNFEQMLLRSIRCKENYFALETRNSVLESQNSALEQRISSLEQMFNGFHEMVARLQHQQQPHFFMQPGPTTHNLTLANAGNFKFLYPRTLSASSFSSDDTDVKSKSSFRCSTTRFKIIS